MNNELLAESFLQGLGGRIQGAPALILPLSKCAVVTLGLVYDIRSRRAEKDV